MEIKNKKNIEEKAREIRYRIFDLVYHSSYFDSLLVAHNLDDLLETYLLQEKRKILPNCYGIRKENNIFNMKVVRPLLNLRKDDLKRICDVNGVPYSIDKTNLTDEYERNKIRHNIVNKLSNKEIEDLVNEINRKNLKIETINKKLSLLDLNSVDIMLSLNEEEFMRGIVILIRDIDRRIEISSKFINEIKKAFKSDKSNVSIKLNNGYVLLKSYGRLYLYKDEEINYSYTINNPGILDNQYFYLNFLENSENRNVFLADYPLTIRNSQNNDTYKVSGYTCKVNRLFIDWKMPPHIRKRWPVILNHEGKIIYIPRYKKDFVISEDINFYVK